MKASRRNNKMHPPLSLRHIPAPLSLFHIATVADLCKKSNENTLQ